jgi:hypothetical protein
MRTMVRRSGRLTVLCVGVLVAALAVPALAGFSGTELYIPFISRAPGAFGSLWYSTVWIYNPNPSSVSVDLYFLERGPNNTAVTPITVVIGQGETKMYENIVESLAGKTNWNGALRIKCTSKVIASARVFAKASSGAPASQTFGQDFAAVPVSFAIGNGETSVVLGGYQTFPDASSIARFNLGCVEVTGHSVTVRWTVYDSLGVEKDHYDKGVSAFSQAQGAYKDYFTPPPDPAPSLTNARITAKVISGTGKVICYGSMVTNDTTGTPPVQDPTTFEMQYPDSALTTPHLTGLFHGAVWSTDGLVVEGGVETTLSDLGLVSYSGSAGLQCGSDLYTLDFADTPASAIAIDGSGNFTASITIGYEDGGATVFTTTWTLAGNRDKDGILTGTLRSDTTGGTGDWASCNGTNVVRNWRAGWTENPG